MRARTDIKYRIKNIHGVKCIKQIQYKFMPLDVIFWSMSRDVTPGSEETGSGASLSGSDYLFRAAGVSPKCGFARGWEAGAGSQDSRLLHPRLVREPPALLLNYPAARAVRPARAPPPRERPSPALGERAPRLRRGGRQTQRHRRQCAGADAAAAVRSEAASRSPARALQGPEEVCWPGTKHAAAAGHACSF